MRHARLIPALAALALLAGATGALAQVEAAPSFDAALQAATDNNQLVVIDFYTDW